MQHITASNLETDVKVKENIVDKEIRHNRSDALTLPRQSGASLRSYIHMTMVMEDFPFILLELHCHTSLVRCLSFSISNPHLKTFKTTEAESALIL